MISCPLKIIRVGFDEENPSTNGADVTSKVKETISANRVDATPNRSISRAHGDCGEWAQFGRRTRSIGIQPTTYAAQYDQMYALSFVFLLERWASIALRTIHSRSSGGSGPIKVVASRQVPDPYTALTIRSPRAVLHVQTCAARSFAAHL